MYSMKDVCQQVNLPYETLKFYCNEGLIPHVQRDKNNYRIFDDNNLAWIKSLSCLKKCGMSITEMKEYVDLCMLGESSILERKKRLQDKQKSLIEKLQEIEECLDYIETKQQFYDDVLSGKKKYYSHLIASKQESS